MDKEGMEKRRSRKGGDKEEKEQQGQQEQQWRNLKEEERKNDTKGWQKRRKMRRRRRRLNVHNNVILGFQGLRQARALLAGFETATEGSMQISEWVRYPLRHETPIALPDPCDRLSGNFS
ncbi:hypothetical protein PoB_004945200 [Plakobranchus ocellatus]|uniref:Uncharacterized protein n=1 Tax=Plakobranchus ocellatus TaxID=259542 RepID=A0AAV4BUD4_9GAST|nr:hypothetical protein PoB_004945200 [Plakobranchus ocellatus]